MIRKYSNDPIPSIVDLGDGRYEFCSNFEQEQLEDHINYMGDSIVIDGIPDKNNIIQALIADGKTEVEANELVKNLMI